MKKIIGSHGECLPPVFLYLDDIEQIVDVFKEVATSVNISTGENELESLSEIDQLGKKTLHSFYLRIRDPYVSLDMQPYRIWLHIHRDDPLSRGVFEKIKKILYSRRRKLAWLTQHGWLNGAFIWVLAEVVPRNQTKSYYIMVGCLAIMLLSFGLYGGFYDIFHRYTIIHLRHRKDEVSFWERNKDQIILIIVSSICSGLVGFFIGKFFGK